MSQKTKAIKIDDLDREMLHRVRASMQSKTRDHVSLSCAIHVACTWRDAIVIHESACKRRFTIGYIEFDPRMMPFEVGCYRVEQYQDEQYLAAMIDPGRIVIPDERVRILYTYPLSRTTERIHEKTGGFSRLDLFKIVGADYAAIYAEEEQSMSGINKPPFSNPKPGDFEAELISRAGNGILNRGLSDGTHGIWGHVLHDLFLEGFEHDTRTGILNLIIGS